MTTATRWSIPPAPACPPWCPEPQPHALTPISERTPEANRWCELRIHEMRGIDESETTVDVQAFVYFAEGYNGDQPEIVPPVVRLNGTYEFTPDQAEELGFALFAAANTARRTADGSR